MSILTVPQALDVEAENHSGDVSRRRLDEALVTLAECVRDIIAAHGINHSRICGKRHHDSCMAHPLYCATCSGIDDVPLPCPTLRRLGVTEPPYPSVGAYLEATK